MEQEQLCLFDDLGVEVKRLRRVIEDLRSSTRSANTLRAYEADWRDFLGWCALAAHDSLLVPHTVPNGGGRALPFWVLGGFRGLRVSAARAASAGRGWGGGEAWRPRKRGGQAV